MYSLLKDAQSYESSNEYDSSTIHYTLIHYVTGSTHITQGLHPYQVHIENRRPYCRVNTISTYNTVWK